MRYINFLVSNELLSVDVSRKAEVLKELKKIREILASELTPAPTPYKRRWADCC